MKKARVGLIVDDMVQAWNIHDLIQRSLSSEIYEIKCIVIQKVTVTGPAIFLLMACILGISIHKSPIPIDFITTNTLLIFSI